MNIKKYNSVSSILLTTNKVINFINY